VQKAIPVPIAVICDGRHHPRHFGLGQHFAQIHQLHRERGIGVLPGVLDTRPHSLDWAETHIVKVNESQAR
jgi:hypothetical protein